MFAGGVSDADASAGMFTLSPENMIFFSDKRVFPRSASKESSLVIDQHVESMSLRTPRTVAETAKTFTFEVNGEGVRKKAAVFSGTSGQAEGWTLGVQHTNGSVNAFVEGEQKKKLLTAFSIYLLVIAAIVAIAYSAMRSQTFAQRQVDFVSSVSHEFRTPLAIIYSAGENLADGVASDRAQIERYGTLIKSEGKKLSAMVEQILEFAGARAGMRRFKFTNSDVNEVVETALANNETILTAEGFIVEKDLSDRLPMVFADTEALSSAIQNLIQNAVKYSNGSRRIHIATFARDGGVSIEVVDNGVGISSSDLKKIFEPFYRARDIVDAQIHGNGLGLSLVKEIAEAHGGSVSAESELGKGSRFTINLPLNSPA
jgi:signal transduction histidine kinase